MAAFGQKLRARGAHTRWRDFVIEFSDCHFSVPLHQR